MQVFNRYVSTRGVTVFSFELVLIAGSVLYAMHLHGGVDAPGAIWKVAFITGLCQLSFYYHDLYDLTVVNSRRELLVRLLQASGAVSLLLAALYLVFPASIIGHGVLASSVFIFIVAIVAWRLLFIEVGLARHLQEHVLIIGTGPAAQTVARQVLDEHDFAYRIVGFIDEDPATVGRSIVHPRVIGMPDDILRLVREQRITRIIVGLSDCRGKLPIEELLEAKLQGVRIEDPETTYERLTGKIMLEELKPSWLIFNDGFRARGLTRAVKRGVDVSLASIGMVLAAPLIILTGIAVRLDSPGPSCTRRSASASTGDASFSTNSGRCEPTPSGARRSGRATRTSASRASAA